MSDGIKWGLLAVAIVTIIAMIVALPIATGIRLDELAINISTIVNYCSAPLISVRGLINCFLTPVGRTILSGILYYIMFKWVYTVAIQAISTVYHFIFK